MQRITGFFLMALLVLSLAACHSPEAGENGLSVTGAETLLSFGGESGAEEIIVTYTIILSGEETDIAAIQSAAVVIADNHKERFLREEGQSTETGGGEGLFCMTLTGKAVFDRGKQSRADAKKMAPFLAAVQVTRSDGTVETLPLPDSHRNS